MEESTETRERVVIDPEHGSTLGSDMKIVTRSNFVNIEHIDARTRMHTTLSKHETKLLKWWNETGKLVLKAVHGTNERKMAAVQKMFPLCQATSGDVPFRGSTLSMPTVETTKFYELHEKLLQCISHESQMHVEEMCNVMDSCVQKCDERMQEWNLNKKTNQQIADKYLQQINPAEMFEGFVISPETRQRMIEAVHDEVEHNEKLLKSECEADIINIRAFFSEQWPKLAEIDYRQIQSEIDFERSRLNSMEHPVHPIKSIEDAFQMQLGKIDDNIRTYLSRRCERWLHTFQQEGSHESPNKFMLQDWKELR